MQVLATVGLLQSKRRVDREQPIEPEHSRVVVIGHTTSIDREPSGSLDRKDDGNNLKRSCIERGAHSPVE